MIKLVDAFKIAKGKKAQESNLVTNLRYIQIGDLRNDDELKYAIGDSTNVLCNKNDILIAWDGANAGTVGYNLEGVIGSTLAKLTPKIEKISSPFVGRLLQSKFKYLRENCTGATIPHISRHSLENIEIPLPPLATQQKIAAILDAADELRQKDKALVAKYDELTQALFLDMFGDPVKNEKDFKLTKLEELYISKKDGTKCGPFGGALKKEEFVEKGIPVWNMDNISKKGELVSDINLWITKEKYNILNSYSVVNDDIIISRAGTVGKMCVVNTSFKESIISTNLIRLRLDKSLLLPMYFVLLMTYFKDRISRLQTGAEGAFTHMNTGVLNDIIFPLPALKLQNQFAERVKAIEEQKSIAQASALKSEELFNSLLQKAFNGELV